ncbi:MAG: hypothetical protein D6753_15540, partial [Planctomycetota bacterium]
QQTEEELPTLLQGWRGELIGRPLEKIFRGQQALRVDDPLAEMPLKLCSAGPSTDVAPAEHSDDAAAASSPSRQRVTHESLAAKSNPRVPGGKPHACLIYENLDNQYTANNTECSFFISP